MSGWGRYPRASTEFVRPERVGALFEAVRSSSSLIPRGLGRSYGDASFDSAGVTCLMGRLNRFLSFDPDQGVLECEAGVTVEELLVHFLPRGYFPPVSPGTKHVTLGGCLACDVHGKNHHVDGSFSRHVLDFLLLTPTGEALRCSREENPDLFWGTVGGMGLTGVVLQLRFRLKRVESAYLAVDYQRAAHLEEALALFDESDDRYLYSVAWIDCLARGRSLGRAVLMRGNPLPATELPRRAARDPLRLGGGGTLSVPLDFPSAVLSPFSVRAFNALYHRSHLRRRVGVIRHHEPFFYPLDRIERWNRLYGRRGFLQYQCLLPYEGGREALARILAELAASGRGSFLGVLKRFGETEGEHLLSFARPGYTLALDLPRRDEGVFELLDRLDRLTVECGGRVYLAKDARLGPETLRRMYGRLDRWLHLRARVDPDGRFRSDLSRRLRLVP